MTKSKVIPVQKRFLSTKEAAAYIGASDDFMNKLRWEAKIHYYRVGRLVLFDVQDIDNLVLSHREL